MLMIIQTGRTAAQREPRKNQPASTVLSRQLDNKIGESLVCRATLPLPCEQGDPTIKLIMNCRPRCLHCLFFALPPVFPRSLLRLPGPLSETRAAYSY